jgi:hypothetical protein
MVTAVFQTHENQILQVNTHIHTYTHVHTHTHIHTHTYTHTHTQRTIKLLLILFVLLCSEDVVVTDASILLHLQSEFADLKATIVDQHLSWRTWWSLKKEKFRYLYPIVQVLLTLAATEAAGNICLHTYSHTYLHACI